MKRDLTRLAELVNEVLPNVPDEQFNIHVWYKKEGDKAIGCPVGWASFHPSFIKAGLLLKLTACGKAYYPEYKWKYGFKAVCELFNLTREEAQHLFDEEFYKLQEHTTKQEVISRIKEFLAREQ